MKTSTVLLAGALLLPALAQAAPVALTFTATVNTTSGTFPAVGSTLTGTYFYDSDPAIYSQLSIPPLAGHYLGYETVDTPYGVSLQWASGTLDLSQGGVAIEIYDDLPTDSASFNVKRQNVSYNLTLFGPETSFTGTALPSPGWLSGGWSGGSFTIRSGASGRLLTATIVSITTSVNAARAD